MHAPGSAHENAEALQTYVLRVNGTDHVLKVHPQTPLLYVLRNDLGLTAAKAGCDAARQCGACAVLLDGKEVASCALTISEVGTRAIVTAEGIGSRLAPTRLQRAFFEEQASQCGYCLPGMIVAATALLGRQPNSTDDEIRASLDRHICRCGVHSRIVSAVRRAAENAALPEPGDWPAITTSIAGEDRKARCVESPKPLDASRADAWLSIDHTGAVTAFSGKVDMGTGLRTALTQIVADELDVDIRSVAIVMSDTALVPPQGKSTASCGVSIGGQPLRIAACEMRAELLKRAGAVLGVPVEELDTENGGVFVKLQPDRAVPYGDIVGKTGHISVPLQIERETHWGPLLHGRTVTKPRSQYRYVGRPIKRDVIADHILGTFKYVHDVTLPGMLHGRVVLPPDYFASLVAVDESSLAGLPDVRIVRRANFLGVVAEREEVAIEAARRLKAEWTRTQPLYDEARQFEQIREAPTVAVQTGFETGDVPTVLSGFDDPYEADFHFGYQLHAMLGPSCAVADVRDGKATIWSGTQSPSAERADIAALLNLPLDNVRLIYREAAGSYGRLGSDDAAADAALMSQIVGKPVRVQWTRRQEHGWAPVATAMSMKIRAALDRSGRLVAFDYTQWCSTHASAERGNHVAWNMLGTAPGYDRLEGYLHGLQYDLPHKRGVTVFVRPTLRTLYLRGPGSVQSHFAIEQAIDELAARAGSDPIEFRLRYLPARDREVLRTVAKIARWEPRSGTNVPMRTEGEWRFGRGAAYTRTGLKATRVGVIVDLRVSSRTGQVVVDDVFLAHDCGYMVNPDGVLNQVQGNIVHALSRALFEEAHYTRSAITTLDWDTYPVIRFRSVPRMSIQLIQRLEEEPAGVGEASSVPIIGAVANALHNAIGRRLRTGPFTPARVLAALESA